MPTILDHRGNPVDLSNLTKELAAPSVSGVRQSFHESVTNGLTPARLAAVLAAAVQGDANEYLTLAEETEERDAHYASVLRTRKLAVTSLKATVEAASDDARDVEIADAVTALTKKPAFRDMIADQMDALGKGYAVSEIEWDKSGKKWFPKKYTFRDQRFFMFDVAIGQELRLRDEKDMANGVALAPFKFIVHTPKLKTGLPIRGGLARLIAVAFMCKSYSIKDWMVFAEIFGMPFRIGKHATGATPEQKAALLRAVTNIGTDAAAIIPEGMEIEFKEASGSTGGDKLFQGMADWWDRQVSKAVLGQTTSADAQSTGLGSGVADAHGEVRHDIRDDDAIKLAATIQRDLIEPFINLNWGRQENYPTLIIAAPKTEDLKMLSESLPPFIALGMRVEESVIRDKFGLPEPKEGAAILKAPAPVPFGAPFGGGGQDPDPEPDEPEDDELDLARARRQANIALMQRVVAGHELTHDQRKLVEMLNREDADEIDSLAETALDDWTQVIDPVTEPILQMASKATSLKGMLADLESAKLDSTELMRTVATLAFKARGRGDVSDR